MNDKNTHLRILLNFALTLCGIVLVVVFVPKLLRFFLPFVIAFIISSIANPFVRFMEKKIKMVRKHSTVFMIVFVLGAVVGLLYLLIRFIIRQAIGLYEDRYELYDSVTTVLNDFLENMQGFFVKLPIDMQETLSGIKEALASWAEGFLAGIEAPDIAVVGTYVGSVVDVLFMAIITILAAYFLTAERDNISAWLRRTLPKPVFYYYDMIVDNFKRAVGGYFKAQFKIMLIIVLIMYVVFKFLGISYAFLLALLISALDFLPVFGTGTILWPWMVIDVIAGEYRQAVFLGILYLVCQLVKQLLQPKMVGDSVGINPLATLLYMFIGYRLGGILGMIIGIPAGMILVSLYKAGLFDQLVKGLKILAHDINEYRKY